MHAAPPMPMRPWRPDSDPDADMVVMADTFTRYIEPGIGDAALRVLRAAGVRTGVADPGCCGRPLLSQGLVGPARARARTALGRLAPHAVAGRRIVVLEPSCWSMLVDDIPKLLPGDPRARWVADAAVGFERAVADAGPPPLRDDPSDVVAHDHCHTRALGGGDEGVAALAAAGVMARPSGAGCCWMAGAFGHVHRDLSVRIAEDRLAPAVRGADAAIAAGTSCREQIRRVTGREALHPAQHMAARLLP